MRIKINASSKLANWFLKKPSGFPKLERYAVWNGRFGVKVIRKIDKKV